MFKGKRTISSTNVIFQNKTQENAAYFRCMITNDLTNVDIKLNNNLGFKAYSKSVWDADFYKHVHMHEGINLAGQIGNAIAHSTFNQTGNINVAFEKLKDEIIKRGVQFAKNSAASRGGYMAENFLAETYNLDAVIKKSADRAVVPSSNKNGSEDLIYDFGRKKASLKFYSDAEKSAKRQTDPKYGEQERIIPSDQLEDSKEVLDSIAEKNRQKGRYDAAEQQLKTKELLNDKIVGSNGEESTPLSKSDDMKLAKSISEDGSVNMEKINEVLEDTGVVNKAKKGIIINELKGIGVSLAIGLGTGFAIGFIVSLAKNGINPGCMRNSFASGLKAGSMGLVASGINYGIGRGAAFAVNKTIIKSLSETFAEETLKNISQLCTSAITGSLTIMIFSAFQFAMLKNAGYSTKESVIRIGKSAGIQFAVLGTSLLFQALLGGCAGSVVSIIGGVIITGYYVYSFNHGRELQKRLKLYAVSLLEPDLHYILALSNNFN